MVLNLQADVTLSILPEDGPGPNSCTSRNLVVIGKTVIYILMLLLLMLKSDGCMDAQQASGYPAHVVLTVVVTAK